MVPQWADNSELRLVERHGPQTGLLERAIRGQYLRHQTPGLVRPRLAEPYSNVDALGREWVNVVLAPTSQGQLIFTEATGGLDLRAHCLIRYSSFRSAALTTRMRRASSRIR